MRNSALAAKNLIAAFLVGMASITASAQIPVTDGANLVPNMMSMIEETLTEVEAVTQTIQQIEMVTQQIQMVENMVQNTTAPAQQMWNRVQDLIGRFTALQTRFRRLTDMQGYLDKFQSVSYYKSNGCFAPNKACSVGELKAWRDRMEDQAKSSQNALEHLVRTVEDQKESLTGIEQKKLKELMGDASNADGQLKAIGSTNALLGNLAQQLMGMRSTQMAMLDTVIERGRAEDEVKARAAAVTQKLHGEPFEYKRKPAKKWTMF